MVARIYSISPKGCAWFVYHRHWVKRADGAEGCTTHYAMVFDYDNGLTAYEAWQAARLKSAPAFYEVITIQLDEHPSKHKNHLLSANTKRKRPKRRK